MKYKFVLISMILLVATTSGMQAQIKSKKSLKQESTVDLFTEAETLASSDPQASISLLDRLINTSKDTRDLNMLINAYKLLAKINEDSALPVLAIQRLQQALQVAYADDKPAEIAEIQSSIGRLKNRISDLTASQAFRSCMEYSIDSARYYECYEGLGLALLQKDSLDASRAIYQELEKKYANGDANALARIQSYLARIDVKKNNLLGARVNFRNAQLNYSQTKITAKDVEVMDSTSELIIKKESNLDDEIDIRSQNILLNDQAPAYQSQQQIQLADAYIRKGEIENASELIDNARDFVEEKGDAATKAAFYKKSSEVYVEKGQFATALEEYKAYEREHSKIIKQKEHALENKIKLIESQKQIDISENVYSSNSKLDLSNARVYDFQRYVIYLLVALLLTAILAGWWIFRSLRAQNIANKQLQLKSLRSQMNPHFIFNALNSVNEFIATQNPKKANQYLSKFSKLMRAVLDVNKKDLIPLSEELAMTRDYLELEHARFSDKFDFVFDVDPSLAEKEYLVPPMLLQPYIENAVWHGLRYLDSKGVLALKAKQVDDGLLIQISDNGIGRKRSLENKTKHQKMHRSTGMKNTADRIAIVESLFGKQFAVDISDLYPDREDSGTLVEIKIVTS